MGTRALSRDQTGRGVKLANHLHLTSRPKMNGAIPLCPTYAFLACTGTVSSCICRSSFSSEGWDSVVGTAGWSGDRIPVAAKFSAHVQAGPGAHQAFSTVGIGAFLGAKRSGRGVDHPPHLAPRLKKE